MSYVVLARRYRPQSLDQIIGQDHISRTLKNAIDENRVAHAYLFSGPRGTGKTTTARFLARALNCKEGPTDHPCGKCSNCLEISAGSSMDVQEIDGASNRGIDEIRELRDNVKFAPAGSKFKIYIIDEAHQITDAAFNALLKTLEEPPAHVVFILATTEPQKIPITILSRCQRYRFRLISSKEIMETLAGIVKNEKFQIDQDALQVIALASGGSMRDALSLLDQALSFSSGKVTYEDLQNLLGFLPKNIISSVTESFAAQDEGKLLGTIKEITEQGYNLLQFARDLRDHLRNLLLFKVNPEILEITSDDKKLLEAQKGSFSTAWLIRAGQLLSKALDEMRWSDQPRLLLELHIMKLAQPYADIGELMERLDRIEREAGSGFDPEPAQARPAAQPSRASFVNEPRQAPSQVKESSVETVGTFDNKSVASSVVSGDIKGAWRAAVSEMQRARPLIGNVLGGLGFSGANGSVVTVTAYSKFEEESVKRNQSYIEEILAKYSGSKLAVRVVVGDKKEQPAEKQRVVPEEIVIEEEESAAEPAAPEMFEVKGELGKQPNEIPPGLEKIMGKFPGRITKKK